MFLQYAAPGAWVPIFTLRLQELNFTPFEVGWACAGSALASLVAPLVAGQVADRWVSSERCIACCSLAAGVFLWLLADLHEPVAVCLCCLAFWLAQVPVLTLGVSLSFAHLPEPERHFGSVRLWGTVGWVMPGLALGWWLADPEWALALLQQLRPWQAQGVLADSQRLGALAAFVLAGYALTLPHTPPARRGTTWLAPVAALHLLRLRSFAVLGLCSMGLYVTIPFTSQVTPLLIAHLGVPLPWLSPTLTIAQSTEIATLGMLPVLLLRLGMRGTMLLGLLAWVAAMVILTLGQPLWLVVASLTCNGVCVCCFLVLSQVFVHRCARADIRASAQGLLTFLNGIGLLAGNLLVGWVRELTGGAFAPTFATACAIAAAMIVVFVAGFSESVAKPATEEVAAAEPAT